MFALTSTGYAVDFQGRKECASHAQMDQIQQGEHLPLDSCAPPPTIYKAMAELGFGITQAGVVLTYAVPPRWGRGALVLHMVRPIAPLVAVEAAFEPLKQDHEFKMHQSQQH